WKPSSKVPLCAIAVQNIITSVLEENKVPEGVCNLVVANSKHVGDNFLADNRVPLISATGSTRVGKRVASIEGELLGRSISKIGGINAIIITEHADLDIANRVILLGAVRTAQQRSTSIRRIIKHESVFDDFKKKLVSA